MSEIFRAFKGQTPPSSSAPTITLAITGGPTTIRGRILLTLPMKNLLLTPRRRKLIWILMKQWKKNQPNSLRKNKLRKSLQKPPLIDTTLNSPVAPKADIGKGIAIDDTESPKELFKASIDVRPGPDEPIRVPYEIHGKIYQLTNDEIQAHLYKEEKIKKAVEEAKLLAMSKPEIIKVVHEEASNVGIDPKVLASAKGGQEFKKIQDAKLKVMKKEHSQKAKKAMKLRKKRLDQYIGNDRRNFKFGDFGITELDELGPIIEKKKNKIVGELMISLGKIYERLKKIPKELGIQIPSLECNRSLLEGVPFVNNIVIEEPEYGMFFIDVFGDEAFQRINDIHKVDIESLLTYLVMASNITTPKNQRYLLEAKAVVIGNHPDQEKLKSKRLKLEALGYKLD
ncbi:hypothetical protein Tco_0812200 [Tanacetum coccineum]